MVRMKTAILGIVLGLLMNIGKANAGDKNSEKAATHFYIVNIDNDLLSIMNSINNENISGATVAGSIANSIIDTIYEISAQTFRTQLGLDLLPLSELRDKIKYNKTYPECPDMVNINKVLKVASGYKYYVDFYVNIYSEITNESVINPTPSQIRPLYAISFTLYDNTGKVIKKLQYSYQSPKVLEENKKRSVAIDKIVKTNLCGMYEIALKEFTSEYKKNLVAAL